MTEPFVRGTCPRLSAPMETGDGLLVRLVPAGPIPLAAFAALCAAARAHGNGVIEISARGSLQVRGLTQSSASFFASSVESLDIDLCDGLPVIVSPLPDDPSALIDAHALAGELRRAIAESGLEFAPKVSVIVDGGGSLHLDALTADVRLRAVPGSHGPRLHLSLAGDAASATPLGVCSPRNAANVVQRALQIIAENGPKARAADILRAEGVSAFCAGAGGTLEAIQVTARKRAEAIGLHRLVNEVCAIGVALPFGHARADDLIALAGIARINGAAWAATAPDRTLLLGPISETTGFVLATAADDLGFVVDARDPRRRVVACPGAPSCASGLIASRALAAELAAVFSADGEGITMHVSGCAKGCAHPAPAPLTIVGAEPGCGIIHNDAPRARPARHVDPRDLATEILHLGEPKESIDA
jgi:precorrin-3B synthase